MKIYECYTGYDPSYCAFVPTKKEAKEFVKDNKIKREYEEGYFEIEYKIIEHTVDPTKTSICEMINSVLGITSIK